MDHQQIDRGLRLKKLIKALNLNQPSFAKSLGMTQPNISRMVSGVGNISVEVLNRIMDRYTEVNLHWLLTGKGEMFLNETTDMAQVNEPKAESLSGSQRLEELEERVKWLEKTIKRLLKEEK